MAVVAIRPRLRLRLRLGLTRGSGSGSISGSTLPASPQHNKMIIALLTRLQWIARGVGLQSNRGIGLPLLGYAAGPGGATLPAAATSMCGVVLKIIANYVKRQPLHSQLAGVHLLLLLLCPTHRFGSAPDTPLKRLTYNLRGRQSKVKVASL